MKLRYLKLRYLLAILGVALPATADDGGRLLRLDHYVQVRSAVPAIAGQSTQIYVREVVEAATVLRGGPAQDPGEPAPVERVPRPEQVDPEPVGPPFLEGTPAHESSPSDRRAGATGPHPRNAGGY